MPMPMPGPDSSAPKSYASNPVSAGGSRLSGSDGRGVDDFSGVVLVRRPNPSAVRANTRSTTHAMPLASMPAPSSRGMKTPYRSGLTVSQAKS